MPKSDNDVVRHRRRPDPPTRALVRWAVRLHPAYQRALMLAVLLLCLGAAVLSVRTAGGGQSAASGTALESSVLAPSAKPSTADTADRADRAASRSGNRRGSASPSPQQQAKSARPTSTPSTRQPVQPVAGLTRVQMNHAKTIVAVGQQIKLPERAYVVAIATAMQESDLLNLANGLVPESLQIAHDGTGEDHDSVGLFQQRPSTGWGSVRELMDPATAARKFYNALSQVAGWATMPLTVAAQTVQGSAFPDAYAKHEERAQAVVDALTQ
jgi:hypothetical protein